MFSVSTVHLPDKVNISPVHLSNMFNVSAVHLSDMINISTMHLSDMINISTAHRSDEFNVSTVHFSYMINSAPSSHGQQTYLVNLFDKLNMSTVYFPSCRVPSKLPSCMCRGTLYSSV